MYLTLEMYRHKFCLEPSLNHGQVQELKSASLFQCTHCSEGAPFQSLSQPEYAHAVKLLEGTSASPPLCVWYLLSLGCHPSESEFGGCEHEAVNCKVSVENQNGKY